jgi:hypothetical protein
VFRRLGHLHPTVLALCVSAAAAPAASAATTTFGADLAALPANSNPAASCAAGPPGLFSQPAASCMWSFIGLGAGAPSLQAPASGTVTQVRVKVGAITGRMRVDVVRFLFRQTGDVAHPVSAGPFLEAYGPEFTPAANAVTAVPVNLPTTEDSTPDPTDLTTIASYDALALEVEDANVPIPLYAAPASLSYYSYPGPTQAGVPAPSPNGIAAATSGYGVLMSAEEDTGDGVAPAGGVGGPGGPGGGGGPAAAPVAPAAPTIRFARPLAPVRNGVATLPIVCQVVDCSGTVTLVRAGRAASASAKRRAITYGRAKFTGRRGKTSKLRIRLNRRGRALLRRHRTAKVLARVALAGQKATTARRVTLRRLT